MKVKIEIRDKKTTAICLRPEGLNDVGRIKSLRRFLNREVSFDLATLSRNLSDGQEFVIVIEEKFTTALPRPERRGITRRR